MFACRRTRRSSSATGCSSEAGRPGGPACSACLDTRPKGGHFGGALDRRRGAMPRVPGGGNRPASRILVAGTAASGDRLRRCSGCRRCAAGSARPRARSRHAGRRWKRPAPAPGRSRRRRRSWPRRPRRRAGAWCSSASRSRRCGASSEGQRRELADLRAQVARERATPAAAAPSPSPAPQAEDPGISQAGDGHRPAQAGRGRGRPRPCGPPEAAPASPCGTPGLPVDGRARVPGAWSRTYRSRAVTFAGTAGARQTRSGIRVFPERVAASWPAERLLPAVGGLRPARALEQALRGIAARYGMRTADLVAMQLEYPKDTATIRAKRCDRCGGTAVDRDARREVPLLPARARAH
jgi:hypothetical protein